MYSVLWGSSEIFCIFVPGDYGGLNLIDIAKDNGNPQMCASYAAEIYRNLMAAEVCVCSFVEGKSFFYCLDGLLNFSYFSCLIKLGRISFLDVCVSSLLYTINILFSL